MTRPRTLAAILLLSALATPALAQGAGGSDNSSQPASSPPDMSNPQASTNSQTPANSLTPSSPGAINSRAVVRNPTAEVQERLQQLGLYSGDIDGKWGPQTRGAVIEFQRSHHLQPTGTLDVATIARLNAMTQNPMAQNPQSAQGNDTGQEPTPDIAGAGGGTADVVPPVRRRPGASTSLGSSTSPGSSTAARATVTVPGLAAPGLAGPGLGYGDNTFGTGAAPGAGVGADAGPSFFGSNVDLSNGYNAAINPNRR